MAGRGTNESRAKSNVSDGSMTFASCVGPTAEQIIGAEASGCNNVPVVVGASLELKM